MSILLTGATGFVGKALDSQLKKNNFHVKYLSGQSILKSQKLGNFKNFIKENTNQNINWLEYLSNTSCVIHCAARSHIMEETESHSLAVYRNANVEVTYNIAKQAARYGVKRFIFLSSVKVNGERTIGSSSFKYNDISKPKDAYAISKFEAEEALLELSKQTGLEIVIIRAPLVYGEGVKGNFKRLLNLVYKKIPMPFAKVSNLRSFIGIENLIDLIICCIDHPKAAGQTFLASDGEDISTPDLIKKLSNLMGKPLRLFALPLWTIQLMSHSVGKSLEIKKLLDSLRIDSSYTREVLGWSPPFSLDEELKKTVVWYLRNR
jgi:nucleoside-diphosphate-sugar epimerase